MSDPIAALLRDHPFVIVDGGLATELEHRGADLRDPLWSAKVLLEQPELIRAVHRDYFDAGADIVTTATYQASFAGFRRRGIDTETAGRLMCAAVALAATAREEYCAASTRGELRRPLVAASLGPYGAMLADGSEYRGHYGASDRELREFHAPRIAALLESGCDLFACETIPCLREAVVLAELLQEYRAPGAWLSFSCIAGGRNCEGESMAECTAVLTRYASINAIGANCTRPQFMGELLREMTGTSTKPLVVYPNSGESYDPVAKQWHAGAAGQSLASHARAWYAAGARLIGGCCRTTPADIAALHTLRQEFVYDAPGSRAPGSRAPG